MNMRTLLPLAVLAGLALAASAAGGGVTVVTNMPYHGAAADDYQRERCRLDLYMPAGTGFPTIVWFHGGGLTAGSKTGVDTRAISHALAGDGIAVAAANYRLSPKVKFPAYVDDAAAAAAWVRENIGSRGGDSNRVFVGGHSAGAYLASMVGMDASYLRRHGLEPSAIAGYVPVSGQMMTHFTVRAERQLGTNAILADAAGPIFHTRRDGPRMLLVMGDRDWPARLEENRYFAALQKVAGNRNVELLVVSNRTHGTIASKITDPADPARRAILRFVRADPGLYAPVSRR